MHNITRRDAIRRVALLMGSAIALPDLLFAWENSEAKSHDFILSADQTTLLGEIAETIVPTTDTPGAKAAGVVPVIQRIVADCYEAKDQTVFADGLNAIDADAKKRFGKDFVSCNAEQRITVLQGFEKAYYDDRKANPFWMMLKGLVVTTYFTSEVGCTQVLRYEAVPGRYDGSMPYKKGEKAWATS